MKNIIFPFGRAFLAMALLFIILAGIHGCSGGGKNGRDGNEEAEDIVDDVSDWQPDSIPDAIPDWDIDTISDIPEDQDTALVAWVAGAMERVGLDDPVGTDVVAQIFAARGEYEPFQVIVRAERSDLTNVTLSITDLEGPGLITSDNLTLYREHYVEVAHSSPDWEGTNRPLAPGWYPDALIPFVDPDTGEDIEGALYDAVPFSLEQGKNQPLWIDVFVPRDSPPGEYTGLCSIHSDQGSAQVEILLTVWNFELPLRPSLRSSFLIWEAGSRKCYEELLRHKIMPSSVGGGSEVAHYIDNFGLNAHNTGMWSGADIEHEIMDPAPPPETWTEIQNRYPEAFWPFLYNYTADEISGHTSLYEPLKEWARNIHAGSVIKNLVTMVPTPELYDDGTGRPAVDIWVLLPKQSSSEDEVVMSLGCEVWSYNCLVQDGYSPKWQIDFLPMDYRIQPGWLNQVYGYTGLLYWRIDHWDDDVWTDPYAFTIGDNFYPGEAILIYPGDDVGIEGPAPSMRLKYLREGVEDYEYVEILKSLGRAEFAMDIVSGVAPDWTNWSRDPEELYSARRLLGEEIDSLNP